MSVHAASEMQAYVAMLDVLWLCWMWLCKGCPLRLRSQVRVCEDNLESKD